jgi:hypothetical protein
MLINYIISVDKFDICVITLNMDDRIGNLKSQIEHFRSGLNAFEGESDTDLKQAIAETEQALYKLEKVLPNG